MEDGDKEFWVTYLNRLIFASNAEVSPAVRLRALRLMLMLTDSESLEKYSDIDVRYGFFFLKLCQCSGGGSSFHSYPQERSHDF